MDRKKEPLDERIIGIGASMVWLGTMIIVFNLLGVALDYDAGLSIVIAGVVVVMATFVIGLIVHVIRSHG
jgi:hypothetical protein